MQEFEVWEPGQQLSQSFLELPRLLYKNDPHWVPELEEETLASFSSTNPFFQANTAKTWVAPGKARLAASYQPGQLIESQSVVFFGFWESIDDIEINRKLFSKAEEWAISQGATFIYGPINFNTYNKYRIRLNLRHNEGHFIGEPYNPLFYPTLLTNCGYHLHTRYLSQYIPENLVDEVYKAKEETLAKMKYLPFRVEYLKPDYWLQRLPDFYEVAQTIFGQNFAYTPVSFAQFSEKYGARFSRQFCPNLSTVVLGEAEQIVGFSLGYPDYTPLCRTTLQNPVAVSDLDFVKHFSLLEKPTYLMRTLGVHPGFRKQEIMNAMGAYTMFRFRDFYQSAMACTMREDNFSTRFFGPYRVERREYGLFSKRLAK